MTLKQLIAMVLLSTVDIMIGDITLTIQRVPGGWNFVYHKGVGATFRIATQFVKVPAHSAERARNTKNDRQ